MAAASSQNTSFDEPRTIIDVDNTAYSMECRHFGIRAVELIHANQLKVRTICRWRSRSRSRDIRVSFFAMSVLVVDVSTLRDGDTRSQAQCLSECDNLQNSRTRTGQLLINGSIAHSVASIV